MQAPTSRDNNIYNNMNNNHFNKQIERVIIINDISLYKTFHHQSSFISIQNVILLQISCINPHVSYNIKIFHMRY